MSSPAIPPGFFIFVAAITTPYYLICFFLYISRINKFPIAQRLPYIALIELFCFASSGLVLAMGAGFPEISFLRNCLRTSAVFVLNEIIGMICVTNRIMWIWHKDFLTKLMLKYQKEFIGMQVTKVDQDDVQIKSFMPVFVEKLMVWLAMKGVKLYHAAVALTMLTLGFGAAMMVAWGKAAVLIPDVTSYDSECYLIFESVLKYHIAFYSLAGTALILLFLPLSNMNDNFSIAVEMKLFLALLVIFTGIIFSTVTRDSTNFVFQKTNIWPLMTCFVVPILVFTVQGYYILYLSFQNDKAVDNQANSTRTSVEAPEQKKKKRPNVAEELKFLLSSGNGKMMFQEFNRSEFSVENLLFYEACMTYELSYKSNEDGGASDETIKMAKNIQETFLMTSSPLSVNISHEVRVKILKKFGIKIQSRSNTLNSISMVSQTFSTKHLDEVELKQESKAGDDNGLPKKASSSNIASDNILERLTPTVFNPARDEIFYLMATDTFQRFKLTKQYRDFLTNNADPMADTVRPNAPSLPL
jgi:hypothetical protein